MCGRGDQVDAVDRARGQAQFAAGAGVADHGVHAFGCTDNGVDRAGEDALHAADAFVFADPCELHWGFVAALRVERQDFASEQFGECDDTGAAAWRAAIDRRFAACDRAGIRSTCGIAATRALGLRQQRVDAAGEFGVEHAPIIADPLNQVRHSCIRCGMMFAINPLPAVAVSHAIPQESADNALVRAAADGDRHAFERLYRRHSPRVFAVILRLQGGDRGRAEELTQDAFVRVWQKLAEFRFESAFSTWLHRLAVNTALMALRAARGEPGADEDASDPDFALADTLTRRPDIGIDLEALIAKLPPRARAVLVLHDVEGWKHEEISGELGMAVGSSKAQLHRARNLIKQWLGGTHGRA